MSVDFAALAVALRADRLAAGPRPADPPTARIFDHLDAVPLALPPPSEVRHFSRIARSMRDSRYWTVPLARHDEDNGRIRVIGRAPFYAGNGEAVSGEINH